MIRRTRIPRRKHILRRRGPRAAPRRKRPAGLSLVELLVAVVVMGVGVLGVTGLQLLSIQNNRGALLSTDAAQLADDMIERIRANSGAGPGLSLYDGVAFGDPPAAPPDCVAHDCTPAQMAGFDKAVWKCNLGAFLQDPVCVQLQHSATLWGLAPEAQRPGLPEGDGAVRVDGSSGLVRATVRWREKERYRSVSIESRG